MKINEHSVKGSWVVSVDYNGGNQPNWCLTRRVIVGLGLAVLAMTATSLVLPESVMAQNSNRLAKAAAELPVVRSAVLDTDINVPWSKPVRIVDPFEGNYVGIFDRNYFFRYFLDTYARIEVVSLWSRKSARFLVTYSDRDCLSGDSFHYASLSGAGCSDFNRALKVTDLSIKIGEQVFRLEGESSTFPVNNELAAALKSSPSGNVSIRLAAENGAVVDSEIGKGTVEAWKAVY